jgi:hypothetical protein
MPRNVFSDLTIFALLKKDGYTHVALEKVPEVEELLEEYISNEYIWDKEARDQNVSTFFEQMLDPLAAVEGELQRAVTAASDVIDSRYIKLVSSELKSEPT